MITPVDFENALNTKEQVKKDDNFAKAVMDAEYNGIEQFRQAKKSGSNPKKFRIKLDLHWPENYISHLAEMYREAGWKHVNYNMIDDTSMREPTGYWLITIKVYD